MDKKPFTEDRRSSDQDTALERAFVAARLPEEDRRVAGDLPPLIAFDEEMSPLPPAITNAEISFVRETPEGVRVTAGGHILE